METLRRSCAKVRELSELRFRMVRGVGRGIGVLDGGQRLARGMGGFRGFLFPDFYYWEFPLRRCKPAAWSIPRTAGAWAARVGLQA